jgi:hypothetical protein
MRHLAWAAAALLAVVALSGCAGSNGGGTGGDGTGPGGTATGTGSAGPGGTTTGAGPTTTGPATTGGSGPRIAYLAADRINGTAPLAVTFSIKADGGGVARWELAFGDGAKENGGSVPASTRHNYTAPGTFVAVLTVHYATGSPAKDDLSIAVLPSTAKDKSYRLNTTAAYTAPAGLAGVGCLRGVADPTNPYACGPEQAKRAHDQDRSTNGTWYRWYDVPVQAGASALEIVAGSRAAQTCTPDPSGLLFSACNPDFDMGIWDPAGTLTSVGTSAALEAFVATAPAAGTWSVVVTYFAGAPNAAGEANIGVYY